MLVEGASRNRESEFTGRTRTFKTVNFSADGRARRPTAPSGGLRPRAPVSRRLMLTGLPRRPTRRGRRDLAPGRPVRVRLTASTSTSFRAVPVD